MSTSHPLRPTLKSVLLRVGFVVGIWALFSTPTAADNQVLLNGNEQPKSIHVCAAENHVFHQMVADTITEAYRLIGYRADFTWLPNRRSMIEANAGSCGAEMMRIAGAEKNFENLIPVLVPVAHLEGVAFMNHEHDDLQPPIKFWEDLKDLRTYIVLGELYAEQGTHDMIVGQVRNYTQLFTMLAQNKIDVGVGIREVGLVELAHNFRGTTIHIHGEPLARLSMYHYVHRDQQHLIAGLVDALNEMTRKGDIRVLNDRALDRLMKMR